MSTALLYIPAMKPKDVIRYFGGVSKTADAIGYTRQGVQKWRKLRSVPERAQYLVQAASGGELKAVGSVKRVGA